MEDGEDCTHPTDYEKLFSSKSFETVPGMCFLDPIYLWKKSGNAGILHFLLLL